MANHKKTETAAKLKKFYSTMTNAIRLAEIEQGIPVYDWETEYYCDEPEATKAFIERNYLKLSEQKVTISPKGVSNFL